MAVPPMGLYAASAFELPAKLPFRDVLSQHLHRRGALRVLTVSLSSSARGDRNPPTARSRVVARHPTAGPVIW